MADYFYFGPLGRRDYMARVCAENSEFGAAGISSESKAKGDKVIMGFSLRHYEPVSMERIPSDHLRSISRAAAIGVEKLKSGIDPVWTQFSTITPMTAPSLLKIIEEINGELDRRGHRKGSLDETQ